MTAEQVTSVTIGNTVYNVGQASAVAQKRLLLLIGSRVALNSASAQVEQIDTDLMMGVLMSAPEQVFDEIAGIVLPRVFVSGGQSAVTIQDFGGRMVELMTLIAESVKVNLNDFFCWLDEKNAATRLANKK